MEEEQKKKVFVSGPVNVIRLEGQVGNVTKVVYLFFDYHFNHGERSECVNRQAIDLKSYVIENLENRTEDMPTIDVFLETYHSMSVTKTNFLIGKREKYIWDFGKYFKVLFDNRNDTETINTLIERIRLHYIDIRDYIHVLYDTNKHYLGQISIHDPSLIPYLTKRCEIRREIIDLMKKTSYSYEKLSLPEDYALPNDEIPLDVVVDRLNNYFDKIKYRYKHDDIRNKLWRRFQYVLYMQYDIIWRAERMISFILDARKKPVERNLNTTLLTYNYSKTSSDDDNRVLEKQWNKFADLDAYNGYSSVPDIWLMDLYAMRRLLDKDEITNAVIYTGGWHSTNYVKMLVRDFDFKITHASYTKERDMDKLNHYIKTSPEYVTDELINQDVSSINQCSDLTDFPKHFS
jgi:hypothetical protein